MAQILELNSTRPVKGENYLIDTNVWFWFTYVSSKGETLPNQPNQYQIENYPKFIEDVLNESGNLCHTSLALAELANVIERTEWELYQTNVDKNIDRKQFRKIRAERIKVLNEISNAWDTIEQISKCVDCKVDSKYVRESLNLMSEAPLDPYDALQIQTMLQNKIDYIVTDDIDFSEVKRLILITANRKISRQQH